MTLRVLYFVALLTAALALVPAGAHLAELGHKLRLNSEEYLTVQQIYRGWSWFGLVVFAALGATLALAVTLRRQRAAFAMALVAFLCIAGTQVIFWTWTFPVNQATDNWTVLPATWSDLRTQWEYSHAASAVLNVIAVMALILSVLRASAGREPVRQHPIRPVVARPLTISVVGAGMALGTGIGALLGTVLDDMPLGMGLGIGLGIAVALGVNEVRSRRRTH